MKEIKSFSEAVAQVVHFPIEAIVDCLRRHGTTTGFAPVKDLSSALQVPWTNFEGAAVVGLVTEPNAGGFHTSGNLEFDL